MSSPIKLEPNSYRKISVSVKQMTRVDEIAINEFGISLVEMMELAGSNLAVLSIQYLKKGGKVLVLSGSGHNGGGGLVAARYLNDLDYDVSVFLTFPKLKPTTKQQLDLLRNLPITIVSKLPKLDKFELLIDSILGYNVKGEVREPIKSLIENINSSGVKTISLDLPSGINPDTGEPEGISVKATATLTLAAPKIGLLKPAATPYVGQLYLADIGIPKKVFNIV